jgi:hypothetical protein
MISIPVTSLGSDEMALPEDLAWFHLQVTTERDV